MHIIFKIDFLLGVLYCQISKQSEYKQKMKLSGSFRVETELNKIINNHLLLRIVLLLESEVADQREVVRRVDVRWYPALADFLA